MKDSLYNNIALIIKRQYDVSSDMKDNLIGSRLAKKRKELGLSLHSLSALLQNYGLNLSVSALSKWENGKTVPNAYQFLAICTAFNDLDQMSLYTSCSSDELSPAGVEKLIEYKELLLASGKFNNPKRNTRKPANDVVKRNKMVSVPISYYPVSAGLGAILDDEHFEIQSFPAKEVPFGVDFGIVVSGDSMEPQMHDGQIAWVQKTHSLKKGEIGVFIYDGSGYVKMYNNGSLVSLNKKYKPIELNPNYMFSVVGRVIGVYGKSRLK